MTGAANAVPIATVERAGLVTVQDLGRSGFTDIGVPTSGAWHRARHRLAVALVHGDVAGAPASYPTFEILSTGLSLTFHESQVIAIVGAASVRVDGYEAATGVALHVQPNSILDIDHHGPGPAYLALSGWRPTLTLGSAATDSFSRLGGNSADGTPFVRGDTVAGDSRFVIDRVGCFVRAMAPESSSISIIATDDDLADSFCSARWRVDSSARSGLRLSGPPVLAPSPTASMAVVPGAIQLLPDGTAIVLGPDGGLTGGYPIVGVVCSAHLDRMADLATGEYARFTRTDPTTAFQEFTAREEALTTAIVRPDSLT